MSDALQFITRAIYSPLPYDRYNVLVAIAACILHEFNMHVSVRSKTPFMRRWGGSAVCVMVAGAMFKLARAEGWLLGLGYLAAWVCVEMSFAVTQAALDDFDVKYSAVTGKKK